MGSVTINGKTYYGQNIVVVNNKVVVDGKSVTSGNEPINVDITGNVGSVECSGSVIVRGDSGAIDCGGSVEVGKNVNGNIDCGGSIEIFGDVNGDVDCGGFCKCRSIKGSLDGLEE